MDTPVDLEIDVTAVTYDESAVGLLETK